jgi:phosphatidylinositol-bisphosphatase
LHFQEPKTVKMTLKNTGSSIAHWRFVPKLEEQWPCKRWMSFEPGLGMLLPGEEAEVSLSALVDAHTADALNTSRETLDDIVVLRIENGKDFFVVVKGVFARSCFGMSLAQLVCATEPVRSIPLPSAAAASGAGGGGDVASAGPGQVGHMSIPKELWRLVDAVWQGGMREKDLFSSAADQGEVRCLRECLDTGAQFPSCSAHSVVEALVSFISALPQPLLPPELYPTLADVEPLNLRAWSRNFLEQLPPINYNVFVYLLSFERELLALREFNRWVDEWVDGWGRRD